MPGAFLSVKNDFLPYANIRIDSFDGGNVPLCLIFIYGLKIVLDNPKINSSSKIRFYESKRV